MLKRLRSLFGKPSKLWWREESGPATFSIYEGRRYLGSITFQGLTLKEQTQYINQLTKD